MEGAESGNNGKRVLGLGSVFWKEASAIVRTSSDYLPECGPEFGGVNR